MNNKTEDYQNLRIRRARTLEDKKKCENVRIKVFVEELGYPRALRGLDGRDETAIVLLATMDGVRCDKKDIPVGTIRLVPSKRDDDFSGTLSRLAVLSQARGIGIGRKLIDALEAAAKEDGRKVIMLECQAQKRGYYESLGYVLEDDTIYMRVGAPHQQLWKRML